MEVTVKSKYDVGDRVWLTHPDGARTRATVLQLILFYCDLDDVDKATSTALNYRIRTDDGVITHVLENRLEKMQPTMRTKTCRICGETKPVEEFYAAATKDGIDTYCKECKKAASRYYRELHAAKLGKRPAKPIEPRKQEVVRLPHVPELVTFEHYEGDNRCVRCYLYDYHSACKTSSCTADERPDGPGYWRAAHADNRSRPEDW